MWAYSWHSFGLPTVMNVSEGPGVEFKVRLMSMWRRYAAAWYAHLCSHECKFPKHMNGICH